MGSNGPGADGVPDAASVSEGLSGSARRKYARRTVADDEGEFVASGHLFPHENETLLECHS